MIEADVKPLPVEPALPKLLKTEPLQSRDTKSAGKPESETGEQDEEAWYVCRNCHQKITRPSDQIGIQGQHRHTFANPSGVVFEIGCFATAEGFSFMGPASAEFTWFSGFSWRITICAACLNHIGWFFSSGSGDSFFGFIADQIILRSLPDIGQ